MEFGKLIKTLMASASLAALMAATPLTFDFDGKSGLSLKSSFAFAGDTDEQDAADDAADDAEDAADEAADDAEDAADEAEDAAEDAADDLADADGEGDDDGEYTLADGTKVEISADGTNVEVTYADGSKEEIEDGQYESKDADGNTVEERPATADDFVRIQAVING